MSAFAQAAPDLISLGFNPITILPPSASHHAGRGKAPGECRGGHWQGMPKWQRFRDSQMAGFELGLAMKAPDANVGIVLGSPAGPGYYVIAVDFDATDPDALDTLLRAAPASPMVKRGSKGETRLYRAAKGIKSKPYDGPDGRLVDLLTGFDARQTVCPPSIHPGTLQPYVWTAGPVRADALPVFDEDDLAALEETLEQCGWVRGGRQRPDRPVRAASEHDPDSIWSETKSAALSNLPAWVPALDLYGCRPARGGYEAVATWRASSSGRPIPERKLNLSIQRDGIKDFGTNDTYSAIDLVMAARDCDQAAATDWLRERLGLKDDSVVIALDMATVVDDDLPEPLRVKPTITLQEFADTVVAPAMDRLKVEHPEYADTPHPTSELPDALTRAPGLVGSITDWICDTARKPQRAGALMAALEIVGTAAGRTFSGPTRTGTHLYGLFLAPSGAAKDHPLKAIDRVLRAATLGAHVGPGEFMSMSALVSRLNRQPLTLTCIDEFGGYLGRINGRKASPHEKAITRTLRSAWGSSFDTMATPEWAGRVGEPIFSPALSIYGVSTHEEFFANLDGADVFNGFLNRFLIFSTHARVEEREPLLDKTVVPEAIIDGLVAIVASLPPLSRATSHNAASDGPSIVVPWDDKYAHQSYMAFGQECERREQDAVFFTRSAEMAQRMATIRAIGRDGAAAKVTLEDMDWGIALARWSAEQTVEMARDYMSESEHDQHMTSVRTIIRQAGEISRSDLVKRVHRQMDSRRLEGVIKMLVDGDMIHEARGPVPMSGGRGKTLYRNGPSPGAS